MKLGLFFDGNELVKPISLRYSRYSEDQNRGDHTCVAVFKGTQTLEGMAYCGEDTHFLSKQSLNLHDEIRM